MRGRAPASGQKKYHTIRCITHQAIMWRKGKRIALGKNPQLRNDGFYSNTILCIAWFVNAGAHKKSKREKLERNHGEKRRKQEGKSCSYAEKGEGCRAAVTGKAGQKSGRARAGTAAKRTAGARRSEIVEKSIRTSAPADMRRPVQTHTGKFGGKLCARCKASSARFDDKFCRGGVQEGEQDR